MLAIFFIIFATPETARAEIITGDVPLGGLSKCLDMYYRENTVNDVYIETLAWINESEYIYYVDLLQLEILQRITEAEATGGTIEQKENVVSCIINRVLYAEFPNTIEQVVFQERQFSPIDDGRYYTVSITDSTKEAVDNILKAGVKHDGSYFHSHYSTSKWFKNNLKYLFDDGIHIYYR